MRKCFVAVLFVVLVGFAATGCATGGYLGPKPFPGPLGDVVAGNLGMTCPGDVFVGPPVNRCLQSIGNNAGRYSNSPMYRGGIGGKQLSETEKLAVICGLGGSGVAMLLDAGLKRVIGAGLVSVATCGVASALANNRRGNKGVIVTPPLPNQQGVRWGSDGVPVAVGMRPNTNRQEEPISNPPSAAGEWRVSNRTSKRAELWDGEQFVERIEPWQRNVPVPVPSDPDGYKAILVYSDHKSGRIVQENAQIRGNSNFNGWDIVAPAVQ